MKPDNAAAPRIKPPIYVGTMGWSYDDWDGVFYPDGSDTRNRLSLYSRTFDTVEIDSTFYGTPRRTVVSQWRQKTPDGFRFCSKVPKLITHDMGLMDVAAPLAEFVSVMSGLGPKRGPMLLQMPPSFTRDQLNALEAMLPILGKLDDPAARFAIEFRHASLLTLDVFELLKNHNVALVVADHTGLPKRFVSTTDFTYVRLIGKHGSFETHRTVSQDRSDTIGRWASVLFRHQARFEAAWVFCNNDYEGFGPETGWKMQEALGLSTRRPGTTRQGSLF